MDWNAWQEKHEALTQDALKRLLADDEVRRARVGDEVLEGVASICAQHSDPSLQGGREMARRMAEDLARTATDVLVATSPAKDVPWGCAFRESTQETAEAYWRFCAALRRAWDEARLPRKARLRRRAQLQARFHAILEEILLRRDDVQSIPFTDMLMRSLEGTSNLTLERRRGLAAHIAILFGHERPAKHPDADLAERVRRREGRRRKKR